MNQKDSVLKHFFRVNERFADLINGTLYQGKQIVNFSELEEVDTELIEKTKDKNTANRRRDLIKQCRKDETIYVLYGTEFQSTVDQMMPVRVMEYDALTYLKMHEMYKKVHPVVTVCLYTGEKAWDKPVSLHEMMEIPEEMKGIVHDYRINVIDAKEQELLMYRNESVKEFFELVHDVHQLNRKELETKLEERTLTSPEAVECAAIVTDCRELNQLIVSDKEGNRMCQNFKNIIKEIKDEGKIQGHTEGMIEVIRRMNNLGVSIELIASSVAMSVSEVKDVLANQ